MSLGLRANTYRLLKARSSQPGSLANTRTHKSMTSLKLLAFVALLLIALAPAAFANDYGAVRGVVHDPQHRPIQDATVTLKARASDWSKAATTGADQLAADGAGTARSVVILVQPFVAHFAGELLLVLPMLV